MGNHEYCIDCGMNVNHGDRSECDPVGLAKRDAERQAAITKKNIQQAKMEKYLKACGIKYEINEYGNALVRYWSFRDE